MIKNARLGNSKHRYHRMMNDRDTLLLVFLTFSYVNTCIVAPYAVYMAFFATGHQLGTWQQEDDSRAGRAVRKRELLIVDVLVSDRANRPSPRP